MRVSYLGKVRKVAQTRSLATHNEYRVYFEGSSTHTRNDAVLSLSIGLPTYITDRGKWLQGTTYVRIEP